MKNYTYSSLSIAICLALYHLPSWANPNLQQCLMGVPQFQGEIIEGDINDLPVYIESDSVEVWQPSFSRYQGNVEVKQGNRSLQAHTIDIENLQSKGYFQRHAYIRDQLHYQDPIIQIVGQNGKINLINHQGELSQVDYQLVGRQGRGSAQQVTLQQNKRVMHNATFTSCLANDDAWRIEAKEMVQDVDRGVAEMWHAKFKVKGIPVFYTPYLQLPLGDKRRSGLLIPDVGMSTNDGYYYAQSIYWNLAPNYDLTFTPKFMTHRGLQLNVEGRYLNPLGEGMIGVEYLRHDRLGDYQERKPRHLLYWTHNSDFLQDWRLDVDYTQVSDKRYFTDFSSSYGRSTDGYAEQKFRIGYYQPDYQMAMTVKQFQLFDEDGINPYRVVPQLDFSYYPKGLWHHRLWFKLYAQMSHFDNRNHEMPTAWRYHVEPSLNLPLNTEYFRFNVEGKLYATHYQQTHKNSRYGQDVPKQVSRFIPQLKVDWQTTLYQEKSVFEGYTQTLEPHFQYLYRPYRDQSGIGPKVNFTQSGYFGLGYDSALLRQDYYSLFQDRRFSGLDRIASVNQITLGGTTRFFDQQGDEQFQLSVGQIFYINPSRIEHSDLNTTRGSTSGWAVESDWKINSQLNWRGSYQYEPRLKKTALANMTLEYRPDEVNLLQLSYRYASRNYIDQNLRSGVNRYGQDINQIGMSAVWQMNDKWAMVGRYYHDIALRNPVEQYLGLQYETCCWAVNIGARRALTSKFHQKPNELYYRHTLTLNVELRGLGEKVSGSRVTKMLEKGLLPYHNPFKSH